MDKYTIEVRFNGRTGGSRCKWSGTVEAANYDEALAKAVAAAVRSPDGGGSIYVTGATFDLVK